MRSKAKHFEILTKDLYNKTQQDLYSFVISLFILIRKILSTLMLQLISPQVRYKFNKYILGKQQVVQAVAMLQVFPSLFFLTSIKTLTASFTEMTTAKFIRTDRTT